MQGGKVEGAEVDGDEAEDGRESGVCWAGCFCRKGREFIWRFLEVTVHVGRCNPGIKKRALTENRQDFPRSRTD